MNNPWAESEISHKTRETVFMKSGRFVGVNERLNLEICYREAFSEGMAQAIKERESRSNGGKDT